MMFSHISDIHLGLMQYGLEERENDIYSAFNESIDTSIKDHVDFVIFAGDIFHVPNPSGTAIVQMANALKRLKESQIESFFVLGEHDISRIRSTPIPYVYHNLNFSKYVGNGKPVVYKNVLIAGFDKIRKSEMQNYYDKFEQIDKAAKEHMGHKILVMHQGISEINKFAGELSSTDLPRNFTYYAMGHLHDQFLKQFSHLSGPVAYPGSIETTASEGIKESQKGFYEVDISGKEAKPNWIKLDTRPQISQKTEFDTLEKTVSDILEKISKLAKKPIVEIRISGDNIESDIVQTQMARLAPQTLHYVWRLIQNNDGNSSVLLDRPASIDDELIRLASNCLGKNELATFAIMELLPLLSSNRTDEAEQLVIERFEQFKRSK
ncbi:MAG: metallophosphoesterase [Candidatus Nitrosotenuis sp.]|nr:metallophosphoesterase [Candidatus Nitrosotenuis sp.]